MAKEPRHKKMYKDSPKLERDKESGKMGVTRGSKNADAAESADEGMPEGEKAALDLAQKHEKERLDLHQKHEKDHLNLRAKHMKAGAMTKPEDKAGMDEAAPEAEPAKEDKE